MAHLKLVVNKLEKMRNEREVGWSPDHTGKKSDLYLLAMGKP